MPLLHCLQNSRATAAFRNSVLALQREGRADDRIQFTPRCPTIKVERTLTRLLQHFADLPIERVRLDAESGCEYFRGRVTVWTAQEVRRVSFHWDCKWRAMQQGWTDSFGFVDQIRAAREFGYDCFRHWEEETTAPPRPARQPA